MHKTPKKLSVKYVVENEGSRYLFCFVSGSKKLDKVIVKVSPQCCCDDFWESTAVIVTAVKILDEFLEESSSS